MRIAIAEDAALFREGLALVLEKFGHTVSVQVDTAPALLAAVRDRDDIDLVLTDVRMPPHEGNDGLLAAIQIRSTHPTLPIVIMSQYVADAYAVQWLHASNDTAQAAGLGYLLKERVGDVTAFLRSIDVVAAGGIVMDPDVVRRLVQRAPVSEIEQLSPRERETLGLMARGMSNVEIAEDMSLTVAGVTKHVGRIFMKLGLEPETGNRRVRAVLTYLAEGAERNA